MKVFTFSIIVKNKPNFVNGSLILKENIAGNIVIWKKWFCTERFFIVLFDNKFLKLCAYHSNVAYENHYKNGRSGRSSLNYWIAKQRNSFLC